MIKRVQIALAVLLVMLAGVIEWQVLRPQEREPVYQGKRLQVWLLEYLLDNNSGNSKMAGDAVQQIGTNAIPTLLKMLGKKNSKLVDWWDRHISEILYLPVDVRYPWYYHRAFYLHQEAEMGFKILGADAQQAVPRLIRIYEQNISESSQGSASRALIAIGPAAQRMAIPSFLRAAASSEAPVRSVAVCALSEVHVEPRVVVPVLARSLSDTNYFIRSVVAHGLGDFGADAKQVVPALVILLGDPDAGVRRGVTNALLRIDPEAAAKAGVK
ncbi:MAG: HEAT repeat domain-containing protein [Limisphaerales bacterium]